MEPSVLFESKELLVIDKPMGLIVHRDGRTFEPSVAEWVLHHYPELADVGEPWTSPQGETISLPGIVHRLDRTTSGVLLIAKTAEMYQYMKQQFRERKIEKTYRAWVYGHMNPSNSSGQASGTIIAEIVRTKDVPKRWMARPTTREDARAAITNWTVQKEITDPTTGEAASLLEITPETGRTHQIRVHLASIDHPIVADHLYAAVRNPILGFSRPALHAHGISLVIDGKRHTFTAPLPHDFQREENL